MEFKPWILCAYYTPNYQSVAEDYLLQSIPKLAFPYHVCQVDSKINWFGNILFKPTFILECLLTFPTTNIVYNDVDSIINCYPSLFDNIQEDLGLYYLDYKEHYGRNGKTELLSGTMFFKNCPKVIELVKIWKTKCDQSYRRNGCTEQYILNEMLKDNKDITVFNLPRTYCYINSLPNGNKPFIPLINPVIEHFQESRKHRGNK